MDPIFWAIAITWMIHKLVTDGAYAVRGQEPPSHKARMAKLAAKNAGGAAAGPARYGARDYLRDLWHDAMEDAREKRVRDRAEARTAEERARRPVPVGGPAPDPADGPGEPSGPAPDPADEIPPIPCRDCGEPLRPHQVYRGDDGVARCRVCNWAATPDPEDPRTRTGTGTGTGPSGADTAGTGTDGTSGTGTGTSGTGSGDTGGTGTGAPDPAGPQPTPDEPGAGPDGGRPEPDIVPCIGCGKPLDMNDTCDFDSLLSLTKDARRRADGAPICKACSYKPAITCAGCGREVLPWGVWSRSSDGADICGACHALEIGDHSFCLHPDGCGPDCPHYRPAYGWTCRCGATEGPFDTKDNAQADYDRHAAGCAAHQNADGPADGDSTDSVPAPEPAAASSSEADADDERPLASVHQLFPTKEEDPLTTTTTGEVTGLGSAKNFASGMNTAYESAAGDVEQFCASLSGFGVSGEAIDAANRAGEAQAAAAAAWAECHRALESQDQVAEAYAATPGAGSREFVTGE